MCVNYKLVLAQYVYIAQRGSFDTVSMRYNVAALALPVVSPSEKMDYHAIANHSTEGKGEN